VVRLEDVKQCKGCITDIDGLSEDLVISTDSRSFKNENTFVSLYGENFDSINFIPDVIEKNCKYVILENRKKNITEIERLRLRYKDVTFIEVENIFAFLLQLGFIRSTRFQGEGGIVIGLTGSNGKTTNKEMLKHLLSIWGEDKVYATKGNLNNQIGVPLTIFGFEKSQKVAIVEMGTNFPGEIEILSSCANPQYGFITNVGYAHIEFLKSLEGVFNEKSALFNSISKREDGLFVVNGFDNYLRDHKEKSNTVYLDPENISISDNELTITLNDKVYKIENENLLGDHQKINMAMCLIMASSIFPNDVDKFVEKAKSYTAQEMNRGEIIIKHNRRFYLDAYNANPSSMKASIKSYLSFLKQKKIEASSALFVLGDMNELGEDAPKLHEGVARFLSDEGAREAIFIGRYAKHYENGFNAKCLTLPY
jgi:UDP-N-acetylmuramoyl-tripeptide--D-alanyl-D-alanine ligase